MRTGYPVKNLPWWKWGGWCLYTVSCLALMLVVCYPTKETKNLVENLLTRALPPNHIVTAYKSRPLLPFGAFFATIRVSRQPAAKSPALVVQNLRITPAYAASLSHATPALFFSAHTGGGTVQGTFFPAVGSGTPFLVSGLQDIRLENLFTSAARHDRTKRTGATGTAGRQKRDGLMGAETDFQENSSKHLQGTLSGTITAVRDKDHPRQTRTGFSLALTKGVLPLATPVFNVSEIECRSLTMAGTAHGQEVTVSDLTLVTPFATARLKGSVRFHNELFTTELFLSGAITMEGNKMSRPSKPLFSGFAKKPIPVIITGTVGTPRITFTGQNKSR